MLTAYRLLRVKDGQPHTLFHGLNGSRKLPQDKVLTAEKKHVWNPGKKGKSPGFMSGWHVLPSKHLTEDYIQRFKDHSDLVICRVFVDEFRDKPRSIVKLARKMMIISEDWTTALQEHGHVGN
jgi:hypothetical protein